MEHTTRAYVEEVKQRWSEWEGLVLHDTTEESQQAFDEGAELTWPQWAVHVVSWTVVGVFAIAVMTLGILMAAAIIERGL